MGTNTQNKKNNREFLKTLGNKLEWMIRPFVQGPSSAIQKYIRRKNLQQDRMNKTNMKMFFKIVPVSLPQRSWTRNELNFAEVRILGMFSKKFILVLLLLSCCNFLYLCIAKDSHWTYGRNIHFKLFPTVLRNSLLFFLFLVFGIERQCGLRQYLIHGYRMTPEALKIIP